VSGTAAAVGGGGDLGRPAWAAGGAAQPRRRVAVDSLARTDRDRLVGGRECLLPRLSVSAAADAGPAALAARARLAATAQEQMAGDRIVGGFSLGLRSVRALGQPLVDGLDRRRLFRRRSRRGRPLSRCRLLQISLSD